MTLAETMSTMAGMSKKALRKGIGRPADPLNREMVALYVEIPPWLKEAMEGIAKSERRTMKAQISILLEEEAKKHGFHPPGQSPDSD